MRIFLLAAGLAISSMASAQDLRAESQSLLEDYGKLPPEKQAILNDAMNHLETVSSVLQRIGKL